MEKAKRFTKVMNICALVLMVISFACSLVVGAVEGVHAETISVQAEHHHDHEVLEFGEHKNGVFVASVDKKGALTEDPAECPCGCTVYGCKRCWHELTKNGKMADGTTAVAEANIGKFENNCPGLTDATVTAGYKCPFNLTELGWYKNLMSIVDVVDSFMWPIITIMGTAGTIFVIILGVQYSKAESADKREEHKKHMINAIIGVVVTMLLLVLVKIFTNNAGQIVQWITTLSK